MAAAWARPYLTPQQFEQLIAETAEPYATMVYVAIYTGLRVSELVGLRWEDIHQNSITIDERCCRGDWDQPKSEASSHDCRELQCDRTHSPPACTYRRSLRREGRRRKLFANIVS